MVTPSPIDYLISAQHESGGWGYHTGHQPVVEPTAAVLLAIRDEALGRDSFLRGMTWLLNCQHADGGWGINGDDAESGWQTAWALNTLKVTQQSNNSIRRAVEWLATEATAEISQEEFLQSNFPQSNDVGALIWPWLPGQVGWIEPTALALIALMGLDESPQTQTRIKAAIGYFERYRTPSGGWNVGNAGPLDTIVLPRAYPTSLVLIALASASPDVIQLVDLAALQQDMLRDPSILAQAAGLCAMRSMGKDVKSLLAPISGSQLSDGSWDHSPFFTAWAMLSLRGDW